MYLVFADSGAKGGMAIRRVQADGTTEDLVVPWAGIPSPSLSLAFDKSGAAHIAYVTSDNHNTSPSRVEYITNAGGAWQYCAVQVVGLIGGLHEHGVGIAVDAAGRPHIVFTDVEDSAPTRNAFYAS